MPGRKKKCPECNNYIYVRTCPNSACKILIREDEIDLVEEQWAIKNGVHDEFLADKKRIEDERKRLTNLNGRPPSEFDLQWSLLNQDIIKHSQNANWGLYRNTRFEMGELLSREGKDKQALETYLWVCYLDLNGPNNNESIKDDPELLKEYPHFSKEVAFLAPGVIQRILSLTEKLKLSPNDVRKLFIEVGKREKLPITPNKAWIELEAELF